MDQLFQKKNRKKKMYRRYFCKLSILCLENRIRWGARIHVADPYDDDDDDEP